VGLAHNPPLMTQVPSSSASSSKDAASELASALIGALGGKDQQEASGDSKVKSAINKLSELAGINSKSTSFEEEPACERMRADLDALSSTVSQRATELSGIKSAIDTASSDTKDVNNMLQTFLGQLGGPDPRRSPSLSTPPSSHGRSSPNSSPARSDASPSGSQSLSSLFGNHISVAIHKTALGFLGVRLVRGEVQAVENSLSTDGPLPFKDWRVGISPLQGIAQWSQTMASLGANMPDGFSSTAEVGNRLVARVSVDGILASSDPQERPLA
jgi:hypothetical protein